MPDNLPPVPSALTGELGRYLDLIRLRLNTTPTFSFFSGLTPESVITGVAGNFALNVGTSTSTNSLIFIHLGSPTVPSKVSWARLSTITLG